MRTEPAERDLVAHEAHRSLAVPHVVAEGRAAGTRAVSLHPDEGIHCRVLLDRGADIGAAWVGGRPVAWTSAVGESRPGHVDAGEGWHRGWAGGLVTTCGLRNVGAPDEGHGRHGTFTDLPATEVHVSRPDACSLALTCTVVDTDALGPGLVLHRRIVLDVGLPRLTLTDDVVNESRETVQAPILYHVNLGHPFLGPTSRLRGPIARSRPVHPDGRWAGFPELMGAPASVPDEVVEHEMHDDGGGSWLELTTPTAIGTLRVSWTRDTLPRVHTWRRRSPGAYVMAIEPANCSVLGRARDRGDGRAPILSAGERRRTSLSLEFLPDGARRGPMHETTQHAEDS